MKAAIKNKIKEKLRKVLDHRIIINYVFLNEKEKRLQFEIDQSWSYTDITFEQLENLSKLLETKLINFTNFDVFESGGCPTCSGMEKSIEITCSDINVEKLLS